MSGPNHLDRISELAEGVCTSLGLTFVDARFSQQGRRRSLEVTIYRPGTGISLDDCQKTSSILGEVLDQQAPPVVEGAYVLEVQSPGLNRTLKTEREFLVFTGQTVEVRVRDNLNSLGYCFKGKLLGKCSDATIKIAQPEPLSPPPKNKPTGKKTASSAEPTPKEIEPKEIEIDLKKVIHVKLFAEELPAKVRHH